jgi:hypothetical protein
MPCIVKNEKGLFAGASAAWMKTSNMEALEKAASKANDESAKAWLASLREVFCKRERKTQWGHSIDELHALPIPGGLGNETAQWDQGAVELQEAWVKMEACVLARPKALAALDKAAAGNEVLKHHLKNLDDQLPKKATMARVRKYTLEDLVPGWEARGGDAWAIWMGSPREQGYMDDKKRPAGAASARLFESAAAAERTAKAAKFGSDRGPAAIVKLRVEALEIVSSEKGSKCEAVRQCIAEREGQEIRSALEEASLDDIRLALGEAPSSEPQERLIAPQEGSLAGREDGYACWVDVDHERCSKRGFVNIRSELGPLTSAVLKPTEKAAAQKSSYWGEVSVVKVSCSPVEIAALIGEPALSSVNAAIAWEQSVAASEALRKQDADTLRQRAAALSSGEAAPRRRVRSL